MEGVHGRGPRGGPWTGASVFNSPLGRPMFWKPPLCLLSTPEGLATTNYRLNGLLEFSIQK